MAFGSGQNSRKTNILTECLDSRFLTKLVLNHWGVGNDFEERVNRVRITSNCILSIMINMNL